MNILPLPILFGAMGTLKKGGSNHRLLSDSLYIGDGTTEAIFGMKSLGGFPSLIKGDKPAMVEVYRISPDTFSILDQLEGYRPNKPLDSFFTRDLMEITLDSGDELDAWVYYVADPATIEHNPDFTHQDEKGRLNWSRAL